MSYFPEPYNRSKKIEVELHLSNYEQNLTLKPNLDVMN